MHHTEFNTSSDLILFNGNVITLDPEKPVAEWVAIKDNKILGVGKKNDVEQLKGADTKLVDCEGGTIIPGFNDAHCHPISYATTLLYVDCSPAAVKNIAEVQDSIRQRAKQTTESKWIRAAHYEARGLAENRAPNRWELDQAAPDHPVILVHRYGKDCVLNSRALQLAEINRETPEPPGGAIHHDPETGEPNGLISGRNECLEKVIPPLDAEELEEGVKRADQEYLSLGITSLQDTGWNNGLSHWKTLRRFTDRGSLSPRLSMLVGVESLEEFHHLGLSTGSGNGRLHLGGVKIALDESSGCPHPPQEDLNQIAHQAYQAGFQLAFHVSDINMLQASLTAIELVLGQSPTPNRRNRLEHCAVCPPGLLPRLKDCGAMIVSQPSFLYYMGQEYLDTVPPAQMGWLFPIGSFQRYGMKIAFGSDSPVAPSNPLMGIYAAVTRKVESGQSLSPQECISPLQALEMYTLGGAYASLEEEVKGSIRPGKFADLTVLSDDPTQVFPEALKEIQVMRTIIDGRIMWER